MTTQKINTALQNVQKYMMENPIALSAENKFQGYKYRGIKEVIQAFSKPLAENNIIVLPQNIKVSTKFLEDGKNTLTRITGEVRLYCTLDGSYVERSYEGHSKSNQGKDLEAAKSFAFRDALLETFCVPFESVVEPEMEGVDESDEPVDESQETVNAFVADLEGLIDESDAEEVFKNYLKAAELSGDRELLKKINLEYIKFTKND
tara:strand:+ start:4610 stop:5224 length:615 start_codon:yes stop_codon:yes gene_type:complete